MQNEMREINFRELFWKIIFAWKSILLGALVGAILFVGIMIVVNGEGDTSDEKRLSLQEKNSVNRMLELYDQLHYYEKYLEESLLVKIDPVNYKTVRMQYYVDSNYIFDIDNGVEGDYTAAIVNAYATYMTSDSFIDELKKLLGIEKGNSYIREVITVLFDIESDVVEISAIVPDDIDSETLMNNMRNLIMAKKENLQSVGEHNLVEINASIDEMMSQEMMEKRDTIVKGYDAVKSSVENGKNSLTKRAKLYLVEVLNYDQYKYEYMAEIEAETNNVIIYGIVGAVVGAALIIAYYIVSVILSSKIQYENDIRTLLNVRHIATINENEKKKGIIRNLLYKIKNRNQELYSYEQQIERCVVGISLLCKEKNISNIYFSSCCIEKIKESMIIDLKKALEEKNISVSGIGKVSYEAKALEVASKTGGVVLLEKIQESRYKEVEKETIVLKDYNIPLLGTVISK